MITATVSSILLFVVAATLSPGGATALATASGAQFGFRRSLPLIAGMTLALTGLAVAAVLGLSSLVLSLPSAELILRIVGTGYLLWLAWRTARGGAPSSLDLAKPRRFHTGLLLLALNPKAWAMTLSAAATFADSAGGGPGGLAAVLGGTFLLCSTLSLILWTALGTTLARVLSRPWQWTVLNVTLALLVVASVVLMWLPA